MQFGEASVAHFFVYQGLRNHAIHRTACGQRGIGHHAHQPHFATPIHQFPALAADQSAGITRRLCKARVRAGA